MTTPAQQLVGVQLPTGWTVMKEWPRSPGATGGLHSVGYVVQDAGGRRAFMKALDYSVALRSPDPARVLEAMTVAYNFERDLLQKCKDKHLDRVVLSLGDGSVYVDPSSPAGVVQYIIFELADSDVRVPLSDSSFDAAWKLRTLHQVCVGLTQLHGSRIAHQDLKPSNVLVFGKLGSKIADLGRAAYPGQVPPHDTLRIAGDWTYAPPELLYQHMPPDWEQRRFGCDLYLMGSMVSFFFGGVAMTPLVLAQLDPSHHFLQYRGFYADVLPFVRDAFGRATAILEPQFPAGARSDLRSAVEQLCDPDPDLRGHPRNRAMKGNRFSLERYVSVLNLLASRAEYDLRRQAK